MEVTFPTGCKGYASAEIPPRHVPLHGPSSIGWASTQRNSHTSKHTSIHSPGGSRRLKSLQGHPAPNVQEHGAEGRRFSKCCLLPAVTPVNEVQAKATHWYPLLKKMLETCSYF